MEPASKRHCSIHDKTESSSSTTEDAVVDTNVIIIDESVRDDAQYETSDTTSNATSDATSDAAGNAHHGRQLLDPEKPYGQYVDESYDQWMNRVDPYGEMRAHYGRLTQCVDCGANSGRNQYCGKYICTSFLFQ